MEELDTSIIVTGVGNDITTSFEQPITVKGKALALRSITFSGKRKSDSGNLLRRYSFKVRDGSENIHTLFLPPRRWQDHEVNELMEAIYNALLDLAKKLNRSEYYIHGEEEIVDLKLPHFTPGTLSPLQYPTIRYLRSGLNIIDVHIPELTLNWRSPDSVWNLFEPSDISATKSRLIFTGSRLNVDDSDSEDEHGIELQEDALYIFCNAIKPSFFGPIKERILDLVCVTLPNQDAIISFTNNNLLFHEFSVDELERLQFYFIKIDGSLFRFSGRITLHLSVKNLD